MFSVKSLSASKKMLSNNNNVSNMVISPILTRSAFSIPDSPQYISIKNIQKTTNIYILKKLEYDYDEFLEKKCQILLLLNVIDEVFKIRDSLIMRINFLERERRNRQLSYERNNFIKSL